MTQTPSYYVNSPVSGTEYTAPAGYLFVPSAGWTATVKAWSGANGTGSLVSVQNLTAYARDFTTSTNQNSFDGGTANTTNASGNSTSDKCCAGGSFSGGSAPGSLEIFAVYTGSPVLPASITFSPSNGAIGSSVTISGVNFTNATAVKFNGATASFSVTNDTTISATVPTGATTGTISVSNPSGTGTSAGTFTVSSVYVNTGTPASPVWTPAEVFVNTGTPASPVWTPAQVFVNTGTPASPVWTPAG